MGHPRADSISHVNSLCFSIFSVTSLTWLVRPAVDVRGVSCLPITAMHWECREFS